jgi:putative membrane protein
MAPFQDPRSELSPGKTVDTLRMLLLSRPARAGLAVGVVILAALIGWQGIGDVAEALHRAGWGIFAIALFHLPPMWADALGWRGLLTSDIRPSRRVMLGARWIGESINDLLPVFQMGGNVVKARLIADRGVPLGRAGGSVVIDVTLVVLSQIIFTLLGLGIAAPVLGGGGPILIVVIGTAVMGILLGGFYFVQRQGFFALVVRISKRLLGASGQSALSDGAAAIDKEVKRLYSDRSALIVSGCWHMAAWILGVAEVWVALALLGHPVHIGTALLFESLGQAIRTGAFAVPGALGIQEGGYLLVGAALGIDPGVALALSLARRVRELLLGLPGLAVWQSSPLRRSFKRGQLTKEEG